MKSIILFFLISSLYAQKDPYFLTKIYFEDAVGNKKEIEVGYDTMAIACILSSEFGEELDLSPLDSIFDIRAGGISYYINHFKCGFPPKKIIFSKRIVGGGERIISTNFCIGGEELIFFIHAKYQPITIRWTASDFEKINCKNKNWSYFTPDFSHNLVFNHEWIAHHPKYACIKEESYTFFLGREQVLLGERPYILMHEIEGRGVDSIYGVALVHDQTFFYCDERYVSTEDNNISHTIEIFPNPTSDCFTIMLDENKSELYKLNIISLDGKVILNQYIHNHETICLEDDIQKGIYLLRMENNRTKQCSYTKLLKQ